MDGRMDRLAGWLIYFRVLMFSSINIDFLRTSGILSYVTLYKLLLTEFPYITLTMKDQSFFHLLTIAPVFCLDWLFPVWSPWFLRLILAVFLKHSLFHVLTWHFHFPLMLAKKTQQKAKFGEFNIELVTQIKQNRPGIKWLNHTWVLLTCLAPTFGYTLVSRKNVYSTQR